MTDTRVVKYIGTADERVISTLDFKRASVEAEQPPTVIWSRRNKFQVPISEFGFLTPEEFDRLIDGDAALVVQEPDPDPDEATAGS